MTHNLPPPSGNEIFKTFFQLGLTSFGGPVAHIGYFRTAFVQEKRWLDDRAYSDLVAFAQFMPGPASSQVGMAIGYRFAGVWGALLAFAGFTAPSALIMIAAAYGIQFLDQAFGASLVHGLKLAAVAVVAHAVCSMARSLCPDLKRAGIAIAVAAFVLAVPMALAQLAVVAAGAMLGHFMLQNLVTAPTSTAPRVRKNHRHLWLVLGLFTGILLIAPLLAWLTDSGALQLFAGFYRTGSLVFGGGHVILPLLEEVTVTPGWVTTDQFLTGYGVAQAIPGPLFTFSAYLGALADGPPNGIAGALIALCAIFLPAFLLVVGGLPLWEQMRTQRGLQAALLGVNAAVVGLLLAALYNPVWTGAVLTPLDAAAAIAGAAGLILFKINPLKIVAGLALIGLGLGYWSA